MTPLVAALWLASHGIEVAPAFGMLVTGVCQCRNPHCFRPAKHARIFDDTLFGTVDETVIGRLWMRYPTANLLVHTGLRSRLFVIDVDAPVGLETWASLVRRWDFGETLTIRSGGGGFHLYYTRFI